MKDELVIITWVSASGKTTLQELMLSEWWKRPYNFTTRLPRWDYELDEYIFLSKDKFFYKLEKWDFLENTNYWWNYYGVSSNIPSGRVCVILDPVGRSQVLEKAARWLIKHRISTVFIAIDEKTQEKRINKRWDAEEEVAKRSRDFLWFSPTPVCLILDGDKKPDDLLFEIENYIITRWDGEL